MTHVLFVCSRNKWRSPTAEKVFSNYPNLSVRSAGLSPQSPRQLSSKDLSWADIVFVMEDQHKKRVRELSRRFQIEVSKIVVLDIPDDYEFMDPELVLQLEQSVPLYLEGGR